MLKIMAKQKSKKIFVNKLFHQEINMGNITI